MKRICFSMTALFAGLFLHGQDIRDHRARPWTPMPGSDGKDISINEKGEIHLVNTAGKLYKFEGSAWKEMERVNNDPIQSYAAYRSCSTQLYPSLGYIWGNFIYEGTDRRILGWHVFARYRVLDLAIDTSLITWYISDKGNIYTLGGKTPGGDGARIAAGGGQVWLINSVGKIYKHKNPKYRMEGWQQMPGSNGRDISVAHDGSVWLVANNGKIYRWYGNQWLLQHGSDGYRIAANAGKVVLINTAGKMYSTTY